MLGKRNGVDTMCGRENTMRMNKKNDQKEKKI